MPSSGVIIVVEEPSDALSQGFFKRRELEFTDEFHELSIRSGLAVLTIIIRFVLKLSAKIVFHNLDDRVGHVPDANFIVFVHRKNNRFYVVILPQLPYEELGQIPRVDKLSQGRSVPHDLERGSVFLGEVALVDKSRNDMGMSQIKVVMRSKDVRRNGRGEVAAEFLLVRMVLDVDHAFGVGIAKVAVVRWAKMDLLFGQGVVDLVREDAGRETGDDFLNLLDASRVQNVVID